MKIQHLSPILFPAGCAVQGASRRWFSLRNQFDPMKILNIFILLASAICCFGQTDTNVIAIGDWSKPVADRGFFILRGRLLVYTPDDDNSTSELNQGQMYHHARVYLELQQIKAEHMSWTAPFEIYYDVGFDEYTFDVGVVLERDASGAITNGRHQQPSLKLQIRDGNDNLYPKEPVGFAGILPQPVWITFQHDTTVRMRADLYTLVSPKKPDGLLFFVNGGQFTIPPNATNDYYLCGTFSPPTNHPSPLNYHVWQGTLDLPRVKIPPPKS